MLGININSCLSSAFQGPPSEATRIQLSFNYLSIYGYVHCPCDLQSFQGLFAFKDNTTLTYHVMDFFFLFFDV